LSEGCFLLQPTGLGVDCEKCFCSETEWISDPVNPKTRAECLARKAGQDRYCGGHFSKFEWRAGQERGIAGAKVMMHYMPWFKNIPHTAGAAHTEQLKGPWFTPLIGLYDSTSPDVVSYHLDLMKAAGVDGVIVDWYGSSGGVEKDSTDVVFAKSSENNMLFSVCYEDWSTGGSKGKWTQDLEYIRDNWLGSELFLKSSDSKPLIMVFGPRTFLQRNDWANQISAVFKGGPRPDIIGIGDGRRAIADGAFQWTNNNFANVLPSYKFGVGAAFPGYRASYACRTKAVLGSCTNLKPMISEGGISTFEGMLNRFEALKSTNDLPVIQLATWNDFGEGTVFEPSFSTMRLCRDRVSGNVRPEPFRFLVALQKRVRGYQSIGQFEDIVDKYCSGKDCENWREENGNFCKRHPCEAQPDILPCL